MQAADKNSKLTAERLKQVLRYDPERGILVWIARTSASSRVKVGEVAGQVDSTGYVRVWIDGERFLAHRLVWLYETGAWPEDMVDHVDGDRTNNRWSNLRAATNSENKANGRLYKKRLNLPKGVRQVGDRYAAQLVHRYQHYSLGTCDTPEEAHAAYIAKASELHGAFARAA